MISASLPGSFDLAGQAVSTRNKLSLTGGGGLIVEKPKAGRKSGLRGDEVYTHSPVRSEGRRDQLGGGVRAAPQAKPLCQP